MRLSFLSRSLVRMAFDGITKAIQFYRRELPESCVSFTSEEGKQIFKEALGQGALLPTGAVTMWLTECCSHHLRAHERIF